MFELNKYQVDAFSSLIHLNKKAKLLKAPLFLNIKSEVEYCH